MRTIAFLAVLFMTCAATAAVAAEWDYKTTGDAVDRIKAGKQRVDLRYDYPESKVQLISFDISPKLNYLIDARARLCYFRWTAGPNAVGMAEIPCKSLKDGYPIMAPIIDWEP